MRALSSHLIFTLMLLGLRPCYHAWQHADPTDQSKLELCTVTGLVISASTGEPINKARIFLASADDGQQKFFAASDFAGRFSLDDIPPGRYNMWVERQGFIREEFIQTQPGRLGAILTLPRGEKRTDLVFRMFSTGAISGHIVSEDGEPAEGVDVKLFCRSFAEGKSHLEEVGYARTNDLGNYRVYGLSPGRYYVLASWASKTSDFEKTAGTSRPWVDSSFSYVPSFYPGTSDANQATGIVVGPGGEISGIDFLLSPNRTYRVRGRVYNTSEAMLESVGVELAPRDQEPSMADLLGHVNFKDGHFEISGVPRGRYLLLISWQNEQGAKMSSQPVDVPDADVDNVAIVLGRSIGIQGRVSIDGELSLDRPLSIGLISRENNFIPEIEADVRADGSFLIPDVGDGTFSIRVWSECRTCYIESAKSGGVDILQTGMAISGAATGPIEVVYSTRTGSIGGVVTKPEGGLAGGALVVLIPDPPYRQVFDRYFRTHTDQYGTFTLSGVPPGNYTAFAWQTMEDEAYQNPEFLKSFEDRAQPVKIVENSRASLSLQLITATLAQ